MPKNNALRYSWIVGMLLLVLSCAAPLGNRVDGNNLKVYYLEGVSKAMAVDFAQFWILNGFVGDKEQTIQLMMDDSKVIVKLIEKERYQDEALEINEIALLQDLERTLMNELFDKEVRVWICDNTFRPLKTPRD
ncbi:MAG: hypothetical protein JJT77_07480 [Crocinitomicaceae bacterium]|nr:hypothetical protein [Crocinitomicaceae bacterium]